MPFKNTRNSREDKSRDPRKSFPKQQSKDQSRPDKSRDPQRPRDSRDSETRGNNRYNPEKSRDSQRPRDSRDSETRGNNRYNPDKSRSSFRSSETKGNRYNSDKSRDPRDPDTRSNRYSPDKSRDPNRSARPGYKNNTKTRTDRPDDRPRSPKGDWQQGPKKRPVSTKSGNRQNSADQDGLIRLNRYISNAGICSRRKADELIEAGVVSVNGEVITTLGTKVDPAKDDVRYNGERLKREKMVYILLNKPKDFITTTDDPQERRTVMDLVAKATRERIYPIGRLDRNTTGLLLLTNDGNLSEKLAHPRNSINKLYHVELSRNLTQGDFNKIAFGLELEDGFIKPDEISYVQGGSKREIGIQIHSGKNRIIRRIFEHLDYEVVKLDRVVYANLTKKDLPRGHWRHLDEKEIVQLKHLTKY